MEKSFREGPGSGGALMGALLQHPLPPKEAQPGRDSTHTCDSVSPQRRPQSAHDGLGCPCGPLNLGNTYDMERDGRSMGRMGRLVLTLMEASSWARSTIKHKTPAHL